MPPILEVPRRESSETHWRADCLFERAAGWRQHAMETGWTLPRPRVREAGAVRESPHSQVGLEVRFEDLADEWERATAFESVVVRKAMHPAYQRIIGMGDEAVQADPSTAAARAASVVLGADRDHGRGPFGGRNVRGGCGGSVARVGTRSGLGS